MTYARLLLLLAAATLFACPASVPAECAAIAEQCHELAESADATATQKECHERAEQTWSAADCTSNRARCFAACPSADGGM